MKVMGRNWVTKEQIVFPEPIYKYRNWHNPKLPFHDRVLTHNELYIPSPNEFEDVKDCRNPIRYDRLSDDQLLELCIIKMRGLHPKYNNPSILKLAKEVSKKDHLRDPKWLQEFEENAFMRECDLRGVLSLTSKPANAEMWRKYGDDGKGICYGFHPHSLIQDTGLEVGGVVHYVKQLPEISPFDSIEEQIANRIYCKEEHWRFEDEYRLGCFGKFDRIQHFRDETLTEVVLGSSFQENEIYEIMEILSSHSNTPVLYKCVEEFDQLIKLQLQY